MEDMTEDCPRNKVISGCLELLEPSSYMVEHEIQPIENPSHVNKCQLVSWNWSNEFEVANDATTFILKRRLNLENVVDEDISGKTQSTSDEVVLSFSSSNVLHSSFDSLHGILISSNILSTLPHLMRCYGDYKLHLIHSQQYIILLSSCDIENASKCHSLQNTYWLFNKLDFSSLIESFKLLPMFKDILTLRDSCSFKTDENNLIILSSPTSKPSSLDNYSNSICSNFVENSFALKSINCFKKKQSSYHRLNLKSPSVKSDYTVDLIKTDERIRFPMKRFMDEFSRQRKIPKNKMYNVFNKNRQFSENALYRDYRCPKRNYFVKDANYNSVNIDDRISFIAKDNGDDECDIYSRQENFTDQKSGKCVASKIAEIRRRVEKFSRQVVGELNRREQHHLSFIEQCEQICDSTISFHDYDEICNWESFQYSTIRGSKSCNGTCEQSFSEHKTTNPCQNIAHGCKTLNSRIQVLKQNAETSVPCCQTLNQVEASNSCIQALNQRETSNSRRQALKPSEVLIPKYSSYLKKISEDLPYQISVVLGTISVPFVASFVINFTKLYF